MAVNGKADKVKDDLMKQQENPPFPELNENAATFLRIVVENPLFNFAFGLGSLTREETSEEDEISQEEEEVENEDLEMEAALLEHGGANRMGNVNSTRIEREMEEDWDLELELEQEQEQSNRNDSFNINANMHFNYNDNDNDNDNDIEIYNDDNEEYWNRNDYNAHDAYGEDNDQNDDKEDDYDDDYNTNYNNDGDDDDDEYNKDEDEYNVDDFFLNDENEFISSPQYLQYQEERLQESWDTDDESLVRAPQPGVYQSHTYSQSAAFEENGAYNITDFYNESDFEPVYFNRESGNSDTGSSATNIQYYNGMTIEEMARYMSGSSNPNS